MKRFILICLLLVMILLLISCSWNPIVVKNGRFIPGETLDKGEVELGVNTFFYIPTSIYFGYGVSNKYELTLTGGWSGNSYNININNYFKLLNKEVIRLVFFGAGMIFFEGKHDFFAFNGSTGVIPGFKFADIFTLYFPIGFDYIADGQWGSGPVLNGGIGINFDFNSFRFALEANGNIPDSIDRLDILPYLGAALIYKF